MIFQIVNLSFTDVFKNFSRKYKIYREVYSPGLLGLELRDIPAKLAESIQKVVLNQNEICYKEYNENNKISLFIPGSFSSFKEISRSILASGDEDLGYKVINVIKNYEEYNSLSYKIGERVFDFKRAYVMGILNITPDSFSDGGKISDEDDAVKHALQMIDDGADIIDVGGESTRPGSEGISEQEEIDRVVPVVKKIIKEKPEAIISIDTTKSKVAEESLKEGAKIVNDISGGTIDKNIISVVKKYNASLVLMHMKGTPEMMQDNPYYDDVVEEIFGFLYTQSSKVFKEGIKNIFIDPGIGFGKRIEDNFEIVRRLEDFKSIGFPLLIGVSRKGFLGKTLDLEIDERDTATSITEAIAIKNGARIIRTHNVKNGVQTVKLLNHLT